MTEAHPGAARKAEAEKMLRVWWKTAVNGALGDSDGFCLFGPSSYALRFGGVPFMIDPCIRFGNFAWKLADCASDDLAQFRAVFLTHEHGDHLDPHFLRLVGGANVLWVIPDFFNREKLASLGIRSENIRFVSPGEHLCFGDTAVTVFESNHRNPGSLKFVCEYGYRFSYQDTHLLFPCDVRDFHTDFYPDFDRTDLFFAHVWLGKNRALEPPWEPILSEFCAFVRHFQPRKVILGHLYEASRIPEEMWSDVHASAVIEKLCAEAPEIQVSAPKPGIWFAI